MNVVITKKSKPLPWPTPFDEISLTLTYEEAYKLFAVVGKLGGGFGSALTIDDLSDGSLQIDNKTFSGPLIREFMDSLYAKLSDALDPR